MEDVTLTSEDSKKSEPANPYLIPGSIIVAGALIALAVLYANSSPRAGIGGSRLLTDKGGSTGSAVSALQALDDDDPILGNPEAPVTVVEFSDFQCPFCRKLFHDTLPQLKEKYIKTGKVKFIYRDFPLSSIHNMAQKYAEAAECADEEGKFWQMHDKIFEEQDRLGAGTITDFTVTDVKRWAKEIGLGSNKFDNCLDSGKYVAEVQKDLTDGQRAGVTGTPGTFINGRLIAGAVPYEQFEAAIEEELKRSK